MLLPTPSTTGATFRNQLSHHEQRSRNPVAELQEAFCNQHVSELTDLLVQGRWLFPAETDRDTLGTGGKARPCLRKM